MPAFVVLKACLRSTERKIPKRVEASAQPCLTPLRMLSAPDMLPSNRTVPCMLLWKDSRKLRTFGGLPIRGRILKRPSLLTRSKALVKSMKTMKRGCCCSLHFSCSYLTEKIISTVERWDRKPHDSEYTLSASC